MSYPAERDYDAVVAGGGPAGAAAATVLALRGRRVLLAERAAEPRFKVGESLMPATYSVFERLGVLDRMKASAYPVKQSVQFFSRSGRASAPFYFFETNPHESARTWQVVRSDFDQMLLDNAAARGAEVRRGLAVKEVRFDGGGRARGVRLQPEGEEALEVACRVVIDATGQSALLARELGLKVVEPRLRNASFFTHFAGAVRDEGIDEGATLIFHTRQGGSWFWFIPLPGDRASVGVVGPVETLLRGRAADPQAVFEEELARCPALVPRLAGARQLLPMQAIRDFSYRSRRVAGDGWVLAGDALGFIDPIYSTGVFLALQSGEWAADAAADALEAGEPTAERLGRFGDRFLAGVDALRRLVYAFYDEEFSFSEFLGRHPEVRGELVEMLVGNVFSSPIDRVLAALAETVPAAEAAAGAAAAAAGGEGGRR